MPKGLHEDLAPNPKVFYHLTFQCYSLVQMTGHYSLTSPLEFISAKIAKSKFT